MRRITIWILTLCLLFGTVGCSACAGSQSGDPVPASSEPQNVEPVATPEEEEIMTNPKGEESALPTLPPESQPSETDMPQTPEPEKSEAPSDTATPNPTPGPTETASESAAPTATPTPTPTPTDDGSDIELPPLP